jgi:hypothetical protein
VWNDELEMGLPDDEFAEFGNDGAPEDEPAGSESYRYTDWAALWSIAPDCVLRGRHHSLSTATLTSKIGSRSYAPVRHPMPSGTLDATSDYDIARHN